MKLSRFFEATIDFTRCIISGGINYSSLNIAAYCTEGGKAPERSGLSIKIRTSMSISVAPGTKM